MAHLTTNMNELEERWMKLYMNIMILKSNSPKAKELLYPFKDKLAEFNEVISAFFEAFKQ